MRNIAFGLACGIASWALLASVVHAGEVTIGNLVVTQAWSRATPGGAPVAGGYLSIENKGSLPDRLLSGSTDATRKVEIHEMALDNGIVHMSDRFDASHNVKLKTYAEYKIRGAILDGLRGLDWAPRQQRKRSKQIEAAMVSAEHRL